MWLQQRCACKFTKKCSSKYAMGDKTLFRAEILSWMTPCRVIFWGTIWRFGRDMGFCKAILLPLRICNNVKCKVFMVFGFSVKFQRHLGFPKNSSRLVKMHVWYSGPVCAAWVRSGWSYVVDAVSMKTSIWNANCWLTVCIAEETTGHWCCLWGNHPAYTCSCSPCSTLINWAVKLSFLTSSDRLRHCEFEAWRALVIVVTCDFMTLSRAVKVTVWQRDA